MLFYSHGANFQSSPRFRALVNVPSTGTSYYAQVPKKKPQPRPHGAEPDWFLPEWMETLKTSQATLARECGWNASTMHGIYHGRTQYYREIVNLISRKLSIEPYELLMHPDLAFALRRQREAALRIVEGSPPPSSPEKKPGLTNSDMPESPCSGGVTTKFAWCE